MESFAYTYKETSLNFEIYNSVMVPSSYSLLIARNLHKFSGNLCLDLGSGSGFLGILLGVHNFQRVFCSDINPISMLNIQRNSNLLGLRNRIYPTLTDMFFGFKKKAFDYIVFNPPSFPALSSKGLRPNFFAGYDG